MRKNAAGVTEEVQLSRLRNSRAPFTVQLTLVKLFLGPRLFLDCFLLEGLQFHGFQSLKRKWTITSTQVLLSPGTSTIVLYYQHKWWCSFLKQVHITKKMQKMWELLKARINPSTHKQMCAKFFWETAISLMRSRQRHLCQPIQPCSPTSSKASPYSLLRKLNTRYTYSQNWTPCSSRDLWPRVGGAKGDVPEGGGGGQRRPDHPDQVARHHRHQRLPQRWQLQGEQEAVRDGSVWGRRHLRTNQVLITHNYWSSVACQFCF